MRRDTINIKQSSIFAIIALLSIVTVIGQAQGCGSSTPTPIVPIEATVTQPSEEILSAVVELTMADTDCLLPCYWGFRIGESTTHEITDFVVQSFQQPPSISYADTRSETFAESELAINRGIDFYETFLSLSSESESLQAIFGSIDDILIRVDIRLLLTANWLEENPFVLSEVLETYGQPTYVYMRYSPAPLIGYILALVYEEQGIVIEYGFGNTLSSNERLMDERITDEGRLLICNEDATYDRILLTLQEDGNPVPLIDLLQPSVNDDNLSVVNPFWDIEDMAGLSIEEFTEAFVGNPEACIEAFSLSELREQGYE